MEETRVRDLRNCRALFPVQLYGDEVFNVLPRRGQSLRGLGLRFEKLQRVCQPGRRRVRGGMPLRALRLCGDIRVYSRLDLAACTSAE